MFSMKTVYGLKALQYLATKGTGKYILISEIAEHEKIPKKFLEAILLTLKNENILISKIGKGGGYQLSAPAASIKMSEIIRSLEGTLALIPCADEKNGPMCEHCDDSAICGARLIMADLTDKFTNMLSNTTLQDMADMSEEAIASSGSVINYSI